jgi:hypothetical protein
MPALCEVCEECPPRYGLGFPLGPRALPGLPDYLRGACLWICTHPECDLAAQRRAVKAAARSGITLTQIWRGHVFDASKTKECPHDPVG